MSKKTPSTLLRSNNSYYMLHPYFSECPINTFGSCGAACQSAYSSRASLAADAKPTTTTEPTGIQASNLRTFDFNPLWRYSHNIPSHRKWQLFEAQLPHQTHHHQPHHHHHNLHSKKHHKKSSKSCPNNQQKTSSLLISNSNLISNSKKSPTSSGEAKDTSSSLSSRKSSNDMLSTSTQQQSLHKTIMQRSLPIFEVLPPLTEHAIDKDDEYNSKQLLYENLYLLDGLNYDYFELERESPSARPTVQSKLKIDYNRLMKSLAATSKPSDYDVIFGNAKLLFPHASGWQESRLKWLCELEQRDEPLQRLQQHLGHYDSSLTVCCLPFVKDILDWDITHQHQV